MLLVVGGNSHGIGKTSVAAGIINMLAAHRWAAMKITQYDAGDCSTGEKCRCDGSEHPYMLTEETAPSATDSGRFVAAGAVKSYWLRTARGNLGYAVPLLRTMIQGGGNLLLESNSVLQYFRPDLYIMVLDPAVQDMKNSARWFFDRADAYVIVERDGIRAHWKGIPVRWLRVKPNFRVRPPGYLSRELMEFVQSAMGKASSASRA
jgi:hypothetical protein